MFEESDDHCCDCQLSDLHFVVMSDCQQSLQRENDGKLVQSFYKQLSLQNQLERDKSVNPVLKQELMYTNKMLIDQIGGVIERKNIDYPASYMSLTQDFNTNIILDAIQNRAVHLQTNPLG